MNFSYKVVIGFFIAATLGACSSTSIDTDYALDQDFSHYQVYQWHPSGPPKTDGLNKVGSDIFHQRLTRLTDEKMTQKGMTKGDKPQFYINYSVVTTDKVSIDTYNSRGFYGHDSYYRRGYYGGTGYSDTRVRYYTQGTLVIDIIDANKNLLIWRGSAQSKLKSKLTPAEKEADLSTMLDELLASFPPQKSSL